MGNIVNRVFDSSGPEGKVRGTPQQIIEKYQILARDAQLSNDRVSAENFMQHAEHYTRMLAEAQRELAAEQEQRRPPGDYAGNGNQNGGQGGQQGQGGYLASHPNQNRDAPFRDQVRERPYREERVEVREERPDVIVGRSAVMMDFVDELGDSGLVETPETRNRTEPPRGEINERRERGPRHDPAEHGARQDRRRDERKPHEPVPEPPAAEAPAAPSAAAPVDPAQPQRKPRVPRKPKAETKPPAGDGPAEAAE
jgi:hypothetical protein